jgi:hypothetical protein
VRRHHARADHGGPQVGVRPAVAAFPQVADEQPTVVIHARRLPVAQCGHPVGEREAAHGQLGILGVQVEHRLARPQHQARRRLVGVGRREHLGHPRERRAVVGRDGVFLGPEVAEERAPPDARGHGDVVDRGLVVAALGEEVHGGGDQVAADLGPALGRATPARG